jgi:hypothetical protein
LMPFGILKESGYEFQAQLTACREGYGKWEGSKNDRDFTKLLIIFLT